MQTNTLTTPSLERRSNGRSSISRLALSCAMLGALFALAGVDARAQESPAPPAEPAPVERGEPIGEAELLKRLPDRERQMVEKENSARDKFEALVDVADLRLGDLNTRLSTDSGSFVDALLLYEATVFAADTRLRSPEANVKPRDKRYKKFERRLSDHLDRLEYIVQNLAPNELDVGTAVTDTVRRLRIDALNSAVDADILTSP